MISNQQNYSAKADALKMGLSLFVFWPAAFAIEGNGVAAAELSRHKGELIAMEKAAIEKNCQIQIARPAPLPKVEPVAVPDKSDVGAISAQYARAGQRLGNR